MTTTQLLYAIVNLADLLTANPWPLVVLAAAALVVTILGAPAGGSSKYRDPKRMFTAAERMHAFTRAGLRCEHKSIFWSRCTNTPTQGDHIYPWSRGGRTAMSNQQALCAFHNNRKSGSVPSRAYIIRLQRRRRRYFPPGEDPRVEWRIGAAL